MANKVLKDRIWTSDNNPPPEDKSKKLWIEAKACYSKPANKGCYKSELPICKVCAKNRSGW